MDTGQLVGSYAEPWKYEEKPGNRFLKVVTDIFWEPFAAGALVTVRHNVGAQTGAGQFFQFYELAAAPTVTREAGSMKYGEPVLHPRVSFEVAAGWGGAFHDACSQVHINSPDWLARWWVIFYEGSDQLNDESRYTIPPFTGAMIPTGLYRFPCP